MNNSSLAYTYVQYTLTN